MKTVMFLIVASVGVAGCSSSSEVMEVVDPEVIESDQAEIALGSVSVPWRLDFGRADCRAYPWWESLSVDNGLDADVSYEARLDFRSVFEVSPDRGTIAANRRADLRVTPKRPIGSSVVMPGDYREIMTITTRGRNHYRRHDVELRRVVTGAAIEVEPRSMSFQGSEGETKSAAIVITNDGNESATIYLSAEAPFAVERTRVVVLGHQTQRVAVTYTAGTAGSTVAGELSVRAGRVCNENDVPSRIPLTGRSSTH